MIALAFYLCAGCAVNDRGLVTTRVYENDTAYVLRLQAWGGHLITNAVAGRPHDPVSHSLLMGLRNHDDQAFLKHIL